MRGIDVPEEHDVCVQHAPVLRVPVDEVPPVELRPDGFDDVSDVRAVEALPLHDQSLRPDHLLGRNEPNVHADDFTRNGSLEPLIVYFCDTVSSTKNEINEIITIKRLSEPVREGQLRLVA